ncbi:DUF4190 domain-containing protein [Streptomyces sp. NPDC048111]|uniref:DUF4190 domain-containing protein n=1 Tax=Streptomyces sp. NPDC048111 TaxID=3365500 RepID=UPI0037100E14
MNAQETKTPLTDTVSAEDQGIRTRTAPTRRTPGRPAPKNTLAATAMTLGITGLCTSVVFIGGPIAVIGLILGIAALMTAKRTGAGRGKAVTAVVTSSLAIMVSGLMAVFMVWYANNTQECYQPDSLRQYAQCVRKHLNAR